MSSQPLNTLPSLEETLQKQSDQFEFHAIVKILENLKPDAVPIGEGNDPSKEAFHIKTNVTLSPPPTDVYSVSRKEEDELPTLTTNFLGLVGINGPIPTPYTELLIERDNKRDTAFHSFIDIFNHRLISIFHRIRKKYWIGVASLAPEDTFAGKCLRALLGIGSPSFQNRLKAPDRTLLYYTGLLWQQSRSAIGLEKILSSVFNVKVSIDQFEGEWVHIPDNQKTTIGIKGAFNELGKNAITGTEFWDQAASFTIHIGPLSLEEYINFLKIGESYRILTSIVGYYIGSDKPFKINLILKKEEIPDSRLGHGVALGWTSWTTPAVFPIQDDAQNIMDTKPFYIMGKLHK